MQESGGTIEAPMIRTHSIIFTLSLMVTLTACSSQISPAHSPPSIGQVPRCKVTSQALATTFCETPEELRLNELPVHIASLPDQQFIWNDQSLTRAPSDRSNAAITSAAASSVVQHSGELGLIPGASVRGATLAELHNRNGSPAKGLLVWVVNISPAMPFNGVGGGNVGASGNPNPDRYAWALVDARTGSLVGFYWA